MVDKCTVTGFASVEQRMQGKTAGDNRITRNVDVKQRALIDHRRHSNACTPDLHCPGGGQLQGSRIDLVR